MSALDDLQRSLSQAVADGRAADPAAAQAATDPRRRLTPRTRRGWHVFIAILLAGGATTGALAATGQLKIVSSGDRQSNPNYRLMSFPGYDSKAIAKPTVLPMRVKDPRGGPDWVLRTFPIGRGKTCAQAGQLYEGRFGIVTEARDPARNRPGDSSGPAWSRTVFQPLPASAGVQGVRCAATRAGGTIVAAYRVPNVFGRENGDLRCGNSPPPAGADCPITGVRVVRWGFLGPKAKTATFIRPGGDRGPTQELSAETGGAYLFAEAVDPAPFRASRAFEAELRRKIDAKYPRIPYGSIPRAERKAADRRWRARNTYVGKVSRAARKERRELWKAQQAEAVDATFEGGETRRVAGRGAKGGPLPGVTPLSRDVPKVPRAAVRVTYRNARRAVEVRFASPIALDDRPGRYDVTVRGPVGPRCTAKPESGWGTWARETAKGQVILVRVRMSQRFPQPAMWCAGRKYTARVRHAAPDPRGGGHREIEQLVGTTTFVAR